MKTKITIAAISLFLLNAGLFAQIPKVYTVENTGASYTPPPLPSLSQLPVINHCRILLCGPMVASDEQVRVMLQ